MQLQMMEILLYIMIQKFGVSFLNFNFDSL